MSGLRSALEELRAEDLAEVPAEKLRADLMEMERASRILEAERLRRISELDRRRAEARDHISTPAWVANRLGASLPVAAQQVRMARALDDMPAVREALASGEMSSSAVRVLVDAREDHPHAFGGAEDVLVRAARSLPVRQLQAAVARWSANVDSRALEERTARLRRRRRLRVCPVVSGMVRVEGELDPETGQTVMTALRSVVDADARSSGGEPRTHEQRRADALGDICRSWLDRKDRPTVAGERPHVVVTVPANALHGGGSAELEEAGPVSAEVARRLACDGSITRVVLSGPSEPLDVGRRTPVVSAPLRRAVVVRDGGCRFPGCGRPAPWCDAHHVRHWADGGETKLANLMLLCRPHHGLVHDGFRIVLRDGHARFFKRDGTELTEPVP
ncbi:MAG TPA: DUF222 domain-containing protein [Actinomycetota bacterium]|nr:DUF222 domain-containing protein [Actinomycetota bacterium]